MSLDAVSVGVFNKALENIAALRLVMEAPCPGFHSLPENTFTQKSNMQAALGRIVDVDVAAEYMAGEKQCLVQASAAMLAQANTNPEIALMLIR